MKKLILSVFFIAISSIAFANNSHCYDLVQKNYYEDALPICTSAAKGGDTVAQYMLGTIYYNGYGVTKDAPKGFYWIQKAANSGLKEAQASIGNMYYSGSGVTKNYSKAFSWAQKAANNGSVIGQQLLGLMYYNGNGVKKDESKGLYWLEKASAILPFLMLFKSKYIFTLK